MQGVKQRYGKSSSSLTESKRSTWFRMDRTLDSSSWSYKRMPGTIFHAFVSLCAPKGVLCSAMMALLILLVIYHFYPRQVPVAFNYRLSKIVPARASIWPPEPDHLYDRDNINPSEEKNAQIDLAKKEDAEELAKQNLDDLHFVRLKGLKSNEVFLFHENNVDLIRRLEFSAVAAHPSHARPTLLEADMRAKESKQQNGMGYVGEGVCANLFDVHRNNTELQGFPSQIIEESSKMLSSFQVHASEYLAESIFRLVERQCLNATSHSFQILCGPNEGGVEGEKQIENFVNFLKDDFLYLGRFPKKAAQSEDFYSTEELFDVTIAPILDKVWSGHTIEALVAMLFMSDSGPGRIVTVSYSEVIKEIKKLTSNQISHNAFIKSNSLSLAERLLMNASNTSCSQQMMWEIQAGKESIFEADPHSLGQSLAKSILNKLSNGVDHSLHKMQQVSDSFLSTMYGLSESSELYLRYLCSVMLSLEEALFDMIYPSIDDPIDVSHKLENGFDDKMDIKLMLGEVDFVDSFEENVGTGENPCGYNLLFVGSMEDVLHSAAWSILTEAHNNSTRKVSNIKSGMSAHIDGLLDVAGSLCALGPGEYSIYHCYHGLGHGILNLYKKDPSLSHELPVRFQWNEEHVKVLANVRENLVQEAKHETTNDFDVEFIRGCARVSYGFERNFHHSHHNSGDANDLETTMRHKRIDLYQAQAMAGCVSGLIHAIDFQFNRGHKLHIAQSSMKHLRQNDEGVRHLISLLLDRVPHLAPEFYKMLYSYNTFMDLSEAYLRVLMNINYLQDADDTEYKNSLATAMTIFQQVLLGSGLTYPFFYQEVAKKANYSFYLGKDTRNQLNKTAVVDYLFDIARKETAEDEDINSQKIEDNLRALNKTRIPNVVDKKKESHMLLTRSGNPDFVADFCYIPETDICTRICKQRQEESINSCMLTCSSVYSNSIRPLCWHAVGVSTYDSSPPRCKKRITSPATKSIHDQHICFLLCQEHNCTRRDYDYCILGYLNMGSLEGQHNPSSNEFLLDPHLFEILGRQPNNSTSTAPESRASHCVLLEDQLLRQVCEYLRYSSIESMKGKGGSPMRGVSFTDKFLRDLDPIRWQNTTPPRMLVTDVQASCEGIEEYPMGVR